MDENKEQIGLRYAALFTGVGGFELGIQRAIPNAECVFANEWDKHACQTYRKNFPNHPLNEGDIRTINASELPDFDLLCGGFPCQTFSIAGKRRGFEDTRGTMFFEIARILRVKKPRLVILENVKGLLNHNQGETFKVILEALWELGYDVEWLVLNSKFFGVPQNRERVFIIGCLRGESRPEILPFGESDSEIKIGNSQDCSNNLTATYWKEPGSGKPFVISHAPRCGDPKKGGTGTLSSQEHSFTIDSSPHYVIDPKTKQWSEELSPTLRSSQGSGNKFCVAGTLRTHKDGKGFRELQEEGVAPCIPARARTDGSGQPVIMSCAYRTRAYVGQEGQLEIRKDEVANQLTTVQKDSMILMNTLTEAQGRQGSSSEFLTACEKIGKVTGVIRRLTPIECERLQGFPDNWTQGVSDTQRYKQMGNAVTVNVIEALMRRIDVSEGQR